MAKSNPGPRDDNRLFSEPPVHVAGPSTSEGVVVPSADQLMALLELRESSPDDFQQLVKCAMGTMGATSEAEDIQAVSECGEESVSDASMDTNQDLDGYSGTGKSIGTIHEVNTEWQTLTRKRSRQSKRVGESDSSVSASGVTSIKKGRIDSVSDQGLMVFMKGVEFDVAKEASRQPIQFSQRLSTAVGKVSGVTLVKDCVRVTCTSQKQKTVMLQMNEWNGKPLTVTEPWSKGTGNRTQGPRYMKGIIFGVSIELSETDIASATEAQSARRLVTRVNEERKPTGNVVLSFSKDLPQYVCIGYLRYKVKPYIPLPIRCNKCQTFGHIAANCKRNVVCVRCGKGHPIESCPVKDNLVQAVCANCKGQHSAAYKGCVRYQEVSKALKVSVIDKLSYRDALVKVRSVELQRTAGDNADVTGGLQMTSTPVPAHVAAQLRPAPSTSQPSASRELFQTTSTQQSQPAERRATTGDKPTTSKEQKEMNYSVEQYLKGMTFYLLRTLDVLIGDKPVSDFEVARAKLTKLACSVFGSHGSNPCLSPDCKKPTD